MKEAARGTERSGAESSVSDSGGRDPVGGGSTASALRCLHSPGCSRPVREDALKSVQGCTRAPLVAGAMLAFALLLICFCWNGPVISTTLDLVRPQRRERAVAELVEAFFPQDVHISAEAASEDLHILPSRAGLADTVEMTAPAPASQGNGSVGAQLAGEAQERTTPTACTAFGDAGTTVNAGAKGVCYSEQACRHRFGRAFAPRHAACAAGLICCLFEYTCGDATSEVSVYFRSPGFPEALPGSLACDFDLVIRQDTCAVRVDFEIVQLSRRLGGVCDLDQFVILNSADGPIAPLCGPMSNFSTFVAVQPGQARPLKLAVLVQGSPRIYWQLRLTQLSCVATPKFSPPTDCGRSKRRQADSVVAYEDVNDLMRAHSPSTTLDRRRSSYRMRRGNAWTDFPSLLPKFSGAVVAEDRIIGGEDAQPGEFPWQVAIMLQKLFFCGGAIVREDLVLTAAHCLITRDTLASHLRVVAGAVDMSAALEGATPSQERSVTQVIFHSHFHPFLLDNDIAILRLDAPFNFSDLLGAVCLPSPEKEYANRAGWVAGWGVSSFPGGEPSPILQRLRVMTLATPDCSKVVDEPLGAGMLCAAPLGREGTCFGDSGGPLTVDDPDGRSIFVGIVSFGVTGCAAIPAFPDVYTRVSAYLHWIDVSSQP